MMPEKLSITGGVDEVFEVPYVAVKKLGLARLNPLRRLLGSIGILKVRSNVFRRAAQKVRPFALKLARLTKKRI